MIKSIKVTNKKKDTKEFILDRGIESGFLITKISGLARSRLMCQLVTL